MDLEYLAQASEVVTEVEASRWKRKSALWYLRKTHAQYLTIPCSAVDCHNMEGADIFSDICKRTLFVVYILLISLLLKCIFTDARALSGEESLSGPLRLARAGAVYPP